MVEQLKDAPNPPSPRELRGLLFDAFEARLPREWRLAWKEPSTRSASRGDAILPVRAADGCSGKLVVEGRKLLEARDVPLPAEQVRQGTGADAALLVVANFLSPRARTAMAGSGISYFDGTGNIRIVADNPELFVSE